MTHPGKRVALITGASAGIGEAFARRLAATGHDLVLTARRQDLLEAVAHELEQRHGIAVLVIPADLAEPSTPGMLAHTIEDAGLSVDVLINNAGYGVPGYFDQMPWKTHGDSLQVMLVAVTQLCHLLLPAMKERGHGRVINVASVAGMVPGSPGHTLYGATKSYLIKFSESLAAEHVGSDVHITASCPGYTYSEFHDVLGIREQVAQFPAPFWMEADEVARLSLEACDRGECVMVPGPVNKALTGLAKVLPGAWGRWIMSAGAAKVRKSV